MRLMFLVIQFVLLSTVATGAYLGRNYLSIWLTGYLEPLLTTTVANTVVTVGFIWLVGGVATLAISFVVARATGQAPSGANATGAAASATLGTAIKEAGARRLSLPVVIAGCVVIFTLGAFFSDRTSLLRCAGFLLFGALAAKTAEKAIGRLEKGDAITLESHWGGLGGGLGGWSLSPVASLFLLTLILAGAAAALGSSAPAPAKGNAASTEAGKPTSESKGAEKKTADKPDTKSQTPAKAEN